MARIQYAGDVSIHHGGYFYDFEGWQNGYVSVTRVQPCSDAGGPDNLFWLESLTVNIRKGVELDSVLSCCGLTRDTLPTGAARRHALIDCHVAYGAYDKNQSEVVQVGAKLDACGHGFDPIQPDTVLRGNASLRRYARRLHADWS